MGSSISFGRAAVYRPRGQWFDSGFCSVTCLVVKTLKSPSSSIIYMQLFKNYTKYVITIIIILCKYHLTQFSLGKSQLDATQQKLKLIISDLSLTHYVM